MLTALPRVQGMSSAACFGSDQLSVDAVGFLLQTAPLSLDDGASGSAFALHCLSVRRSLIRSFARARTPHTGRLTRPRPGPTLAR